MIEYHSLPPRDPAAAGSKSPTLVILHGYGANEHDLMGIASQLDPRFLAISLRAPIGLSWGGYAWYHLEQTPRGILPDDASRFESEELVLGSLKGILDAEGGDPTRVVLMGFSQGGAVCYSLLTRGNLSQQGITVKAVIIMSSYVPRDIMQSLEEKDFTGLPMFISHGLHDDLIPVQARTEAEGLFAGRGAEVVGKTYEVGHGVIQETIDDIRTWLKNQGV